MNPPLTKIKISKGFRQIGDGIRCGNSICNGSSVENSLMKYYHRFLK